MKKMQWWKDLSSKESGKWSIEKKREKKEKKRNVFVRQKESHYHLPSECCLNDTLLVGLCVKFSVCALVPVCLLWYASFHFWLAIHFDWFSFSVVFIFLNSFRNACSLFSTLYGFWFMWRKFNASDLRKWM